VKIVQNHPLKNLHTFGIDVKSKYFVEINSKAELQELIKTPTFQSNPRIILGGGSNCLFTQDYEGLVIKINIKGQEVLEETPGYVILSANAGEDWHEFVMDCIKRGYGGIENLVYIPGTVGASPIQNIGAYGVELKDSFLELEALSLDSQKFITFSKEACKFSYRESVFKNQLKDKYIINRVVFKLTKANHKLNFSYGALEHELKVSKCLSKNDEINTSDISLEDICDCIIKIRKSKLPDPDEIGNAGSFFKNPSVDKDLVSKLKREYSDIPSYPSDTSDRIKLSAGWLIDKAGWKGWTSEDSTYGVHKNHALILVNYGGAKGQDIYNLSEEIINSVEEKFGIRLEREVNIY
jgi:UDP-N-acetylmuramate dehydrogenase